jgi:hypothetical protein
MWDYSRLSLLLLPVAACGPIAAKPLSACGDQIRFVTLTTKFPNPDDPTAGAAQVQFVEHKVEEPRQKMTWVVLDRSLRGHVLSAQLSDVPTRQIIRALPAVSGVGDEALKGQAAPYSGPPDFVELFQLAQDGKLSLLLRTDVAGRDSLERVLTVAEVQQWAELVCN